jgi:hypothetical protein
MGEPVKGADEEPTTLPSSLDGAEKKVPPVQVAEKVADSISTGNRLRKVPEQPEPDEDSRVAVPTGDFLEAHPPVVREELRESDTVGPADGGIFAADTQMRTNKYRAKGSAVAAGDRSKGGPAPEVRQYTLDIADAESVQVVSLAAEPVLEEIEFGSEIPRATQHVAPMSVDARDLQTISPPAKYDSLIAYYDSQSGAEADSLAADYAYQRAVAYPTSDNIEAAVERIKTLVDRTESPATRQYYRALLEHLADLK